MVPGHPMALDHTVLKGHEQLHLCPQVTSLHGTTRASMIFHSMEKHLCDMFQSDPMGSALIPLISVLQGATLAGEDTAGIVLREAKTRSRLLLVT
jgi:hypothetical protein